MISKEEKTGAIQITGYALSVAGLGVIALSNKISSMLKFLGTKSMIYTVLGGAVLITIGIVLIVSEGPSNKYKAKHAGEQVPIYAGEGKKRKIIGYQKAQD